MNKEEILNTFLLANIPEIITQEEFDDVKKSIKELLQENKKYKEVIDRLNFIKNRKNQGASQENINKMAIEFVNSYLKEVSEWK